MLRSIQSKQVISQPACLYFMVQLQNVIGHAHKIPFHHNVDLSSGQKATEVHIFLDHSEHTFCLNGTIYPEQDPFVCGDLFLHRLTLLDKILGHIETLYPVFQWCFVSFLLPDTRFFDGTIFAICAFVDARLPDISRLRFLFFLLSPPVISAPGHRCIHLFLHHRP